MNVKKYLYDKTARRGRRFFALLLTAFLVFQSGMGIQAAQEEPFRLAIFHPQTLNPLKTVDPSVAQLLMIIFSPLIDTDTNGNPTDQGLVQSWELSEDGKQLSLTLNKDEKFSNGEDVLEEDVVYSLFALKNADQNFWKEGLRFLDEIEIVTFVKNDRGRWERWDEDYDSDWDDEEERENPEEEMEEEEESGENDTSSASRKKKRVLQLRFTSVIDVDHLGFLTVPILPRSVYQTENPPEWIPVGSGPYRVVSYETMNRIELEENPYYDRFCKIPRIRVDITRTQEAISTAFQNGLTQMIYEEVPSSLSISNLDHNHVYYVDIHQLRYLKFNQQVGRFFAEKEHRQALMVMLSMEEILQRTAALQGEIATSLVPDWICPIELSDDYEYDEQRLQRLLGETSIPPIRILVVEGDQLAQNQAQLIQRTLQSNGLGCVVESVRTQEVSLAWNSGGYDMTFGEYKVETPQDLRSLLLEQANLHNSAEIEKISGMLDKAMTSETRDERKKAWLEITQYLWEDLPICPMYYMKQSVVVAESISGKLKGTPYMVYRGIEYLNQ